MWETDSREQTRQQATYNKLEEAILKLEDANAKILHYERLLHALRTEPEDEALRLLWRLRGGAEGAWLPEGMELGVQGLEGMEGVMGPGWGVGMEGMGAGVFLADGQGHHNHPHQAYGGGGERGAYGDMRRT
ncbi:hypothetical protein MPH_01374 [Macrophomina phaseolina MS6]|uniref:Uncharacterized protein n=1 Tax=Macrophomina phaseolina (strain MS6) TaxID=1126212 RepID=K2S924_MACPH|nr:hypothetical protein MPH_01374 [Macrophomina phaseolina MS6]